MTAYLDTPEQWDAAIAAARKAGIMGLDTETFGHNVKTSSPSHRACVHVWSVALRTGTLDPKGYHLARGAVLPAVALDHPAWRELIGDPAVTKVLHNAPHDAHSLANRGVVLRGWLDTLELARLVHPGRWNGYDLKTLAIEILGKPERELYKQVVGTTVISEKAELGTCPGGTDGRPCKPDPQHCGYRSGGHGRPRTVTLVERPGPELALESIVPGHERWSRLLEYAAADAVDALELAQVLNRRADRVVRPPVPWA